MMLLLKNNLALSNMMDFNFPTTNNVAIKMNAKDMLLKPSTLGLGNGKPLIGWWDSDLNFSSPASCLRFVEAKCRCLMETPPPPFIIRTLTEMIEFV
jgi:hypothetical protein